MTALIHSALRVMARWLARLQEFSSFSFRCRGEFHYCRRRRIDMESAVRKREGGAPAGAFRKSWYLSLRVRPGTSLSTVSPSCTRLMARTRHALAKTKPGAWEYDVDSPMVQTQHDRHLTASSQVSSKFERYPSMLEKRHEMVSLYNAGIAFSQRWP